MSYEWPLQPSELFRERTPQMLLDLTAEDVIAMRTAITRMWADEPGGWVYEWSELARGYASAGRHDLATAAFGWAKFPTLANEAASRALQSQIAQYLLWSRKFPVNFEREMIEVPYEGETTTVAIHWLSNKDASADAPVLLASGGVDAWKSDLHGIFQTFVLHAGVRVMAFDIPGTGESKTALSPKGAQVIAGLVNEARRRGARKVGHLGISMGGYYSAISGLSGCVDAAIVLGGPVEAAFGPGREWQFGMADIVGNALGFDSAPERQEIGRVMEAFSLSSLLNQHANAPMLVINGADDVHIPQHDTMVFSGRKNTEVHLLENSGHCAVSRLAEVVPMMLQWTRKHLGQS